MRGIFWANREKCFVQNQGQRTHYLDVDRDGPSAYGGDGKQLARGGLFTSPGHLFFPAAASLPVFRGALEGLRRIATYHIDPSSLRPSQPKRPYGPLARNGSNVASVLQRLEEHSFWRQRVQASLAVIDPSLQGIAVHDLAERLGIEFQQSGLMDAPVRFWAENMSDGTLHALGVLVALYQYVLGTVSLVGLEEPETALHPGASAALRDAIEEASFGVQVIVTSHSADLLDDKHVRPDSILAVCADPAGTRIGLLGEVERSVLRDKLFTVGELLRMEQLRPGVDASSLREADLFAPMADSV